MNQRDQWQQEYGIEKIIDVYDLLNELFGNGLLPALHIQETAIRQYCLENNAYWYKFTPKNENVRWTIMQAAAHGYKIIIWDMQS